MGVVLGCALCLLPKTRERSVIIENILVGMFGAYIGGDFVATMMDGVAAGEDFSFSAFGYAVLGAVVLLLALKLMRYKVGALRVGKKPRRR